MFIPSESSIMLALLWTAKRFQLVSEFDGNLQVVTNLEAESLCYSLSPVISEVRLKLLLIKRLLLIGSPLETTSLSIHIFSDWHFNRIRSLSVSSLSLSILSASPKTPFSCPLILYGGRLLLYGSGSPPLINDSHLR